MLRDIYSKSKQLAVKVNNVIMNYTPVEIKVREATNDDPWGAHNTLLLDIAKLTLTQEYFPEVMGTIWKRLFHEDSGWRKIYKTLTLMDYLIISGSERVVLSVRDHAYDLRSLLSYEFIDEHGKDQGINVRYRVNSILELINNDKKISEARHRQKIVRDRYQGFSNLTAQYCGGTNVGQQQPEVKQQYSLGDFDAWQDGVEQGTIRYMANSVLEKVSHFWDSQVVVTPSTETAACDSTSPGDFFSNSNKNYSHEDERNNTVNRKQDHVKFQPKKQDGELLDFKIASPVAKPQNPPAALPRVPSLLMENKTSNIDNMLLFDPFESSPATKVVQNESNNAAIDFDPFDLHQTQETSSLFSNLTLPLTVANQAQGIGNMSTSSNTAIPSLLDDEFSPWTSASQAGSNAFTMRDGPVMNHTVADVADAFQAPATQSFEKPKPAVGKLWQDIGNLQIDVDCTVLPKKPTLHQMRNNKF